jgi:hypothetical protein
VVYGIPVEINPEFLKHTDITNRAFLLRLLFNLKRIYFKGTQWRLNMACFYVKDGIVGVTDDWKFFQ